MHLILSELDASASSGAIATRSRPALTKDAPVSHYAKGAQLLGLSLVQVPGAANTGGSQPDRHPPASTSHVPQSDGE